MAKKKHGAHGGGHGWYVTFADLMGLLMSFFVVLVASSTQDAKRLAALAGSMREAFGVQPIQRDAGIIERDGLPIRPTMRYVEDKQPTDPTDRAGPQNDEAKDADLKTSRDFAFASAAASLRQALQDLPDFAEISRNILVEDTPKGVNLQLTDQDGRSMFAENSSRPYERTRRVLEAVAPVIRAMPNRIAITGHTSALGPAAIPEPGSDAWALSVGRAAAVRDLLAKAGVPADHFAEVSGKADTQPLYPDDPALAANRRVSILLLNEAPPLPPNARP